MMENRRYEKVLIIGNGFDLSLGLKTKYEDFMKSPDFTDLIRPNNLFAHLMNEKRLKNWIDIEIELKRYSKQYANNEFETQYNQLCSALTNYISNIDYGRINKSSDAYKLLERLLGQDCIIFDYNYTNSLFNIGNELGIDLTYLERKIVKVHGSAKEGKIIFGVEDNANINPEHIFLKKAYPPYYKAISLNFHLKNATEINIFGHSLGETDHTYFSHFFQTASNEQIFEDKRAVRLYYYDQIGYKDQHIQLDKLTQQRLGGFKHKSYFEPIQVK